MKPGRNDPCRCNSGKKFKHCCGSTLAPQPPTLLSRSKIDALVELINHERLGDAERATRALLASYPDSGILWKVLSVSLARQGKDALAALRKSAALNPTDAEAQGNLGAALHDLGQWSAALESLNRALALRPDDVGALTDAGNALLGLGRAPQAISYYQRALQSEPGHAEAHNNLGDAFRELGHFDLAVESYRRALVVRPDFAPTHMNLGLALRQLGRPAEAESSCQNALRINPRYVEALTLLGELRSDRGLFGEAQQYFERALTLNAEFAPAYAGIAANRQMNSADTAWAQGAEALLTKALPLAHEIGLRYALGKYFDDVGAYAQAFAHYQRANELSKSHGNPYDRENFARRIDRIITSFDAAFASRFEAPTEHTEPPVFVVGMPRSGTSLTEQILASHPEVAGVGEVMFWNEAYNVYRREERGDKVDASLLARIGRDYRTRLATLSDRESRRVIDKMPANFLYLGLIHATFPGARIIHMRRHPLDTCLSIHFQHFSGMGPYANDLEDLAHYYGEYLRIMRHWRAVLPATALLEVPYEALVKNQEEWSRRMIDFIGLPWSPQCLDFHRTVRAVNTSSKWQVRQRIHSKSVGRWMNYANFLGPLRAALGDAVERYSAADPTAGQAGSTTNDFPSPLGPS